MTMVDLNDGNWKVYDFSQSIKRKANTKTTEDKLLTKLIDARLKKKLSRRALAEQSGVCLPTITQIENCGRNPTLKMFVKLATALGLEIKLVPKPR